MQQTTPTGKLESITQALPEFSSMLNPVTGCFKDPKREQQALNQLWPQERYAFRLPILIYSLLILSGGVLDYGWYQLSAHFWGFFSLRFIMVLLALWLFLGTRQAVRPANYDSLITLFQSYILLFYFAIFYDRWFLNTHHVISESFFTVLFISYPLMCCFVFPSKVRASCLNSAFSLVTYVFILSLLPEVNLRNKMTEFLAFFFFIYYAYNLMRSKNKNKRALLMYEEKQNEAILLAQKESQDKSRFIAATSHDLRQPLHSLSIYNDLLAQQTHTSEAKAVITKSRQAIDSLKDYFDSLIDISRLDAGTTSTHVEHFALQEVIQQQIDELAPSFPHITVRNIPTRAVVYSDKLILSKCIQQLLKNALLHGTGQQGVQKVLIGVRLSVSEIKLQVLDQGVGIAADQLDSIFDEFSQLNNPERNRNKGLGLGLALVKKSCQALSLPLHVDSKENQGTCFSVTLPRGDYHQISVANVQSIEPEVASDQAQILLLDDDIMILDAMAEMLESWDYRVYKAENAEQALSVAKKITPDMIISDYNLPGRSNGPETLAQINQLYGAPVPAIILTGDINIPVNHSLEPNGYLVLHKPIKGAQLRVAMKKIYNNKVK
ncbi:ATP-binding response regulator [Motilimonas pumila]|uniref:histidine kinase n=1 Tax=Motilimonas pumila TaxID=2303987 RepID=A0A418YF21_9GAMM|nr:hybrid sensor histidine kinase/response regulator [Motilimonas pumila]RJG47868.1 response regulator [Motilimonas pumila]